MLWGNCPIVGKWRSQVLTNGQFRRLFPRNLQKGLRPENAGFFVPKSDQKSGQSLGQTKQMVLSERRTIRSKTPWG
jgi:hypothetical protein